MKLSLVITLLVILALAGVYFLTKSTYTKEKKYNWNLELTKPLAYDIQLQNISYYRGEEEIIRNTTLNIFSGWSGMASGNVLHAKATEYLPDRVKLSWKDVGINKTYTLEFEFPKQTIVAYWNENYALLQQKWGNDHPQGPLSLKVGVAPEGQVTLWLSDMDVNASGFAVEVASYVATLEAISQESTVKNTVSTTANLRFGTPHFYPFTTENVVAINILYRNGESHTINLKKENGSLLDNINKKRGWGMAKEIMVHWFDRDGKGYTATYEISLDELHIKDTPENLREIQFVYLLGRQNTPDGAWNKLTNKRIFQLTETKQKVIN